MLPVKKTLTKNWQFFNFINGLSNRSQWFWVKPGGNTTL